VSFQLLSGSASRALKRLSCSREEMCYSLRLYFDDEVVSTLPLSIGQGEWLPRRWRSYDP